MRFIKQLPKTIQEDIRTQVQMKDYTTMCVGGPADYFYSVKDEDSLREILKEAYKNKIPITILGQGSNVIVSDKGIRGLVLFFGEDYSSVNIEEIDEAQQDQIKDLAISPLKPLGRAYQMCVQTGALLKDISKQALEQSLSGLEFACGIPGSVGGAICMNAGAYGNMMQDITISTRVMDQDGIIRTVSGSEHAFGYRKSFLTQTNTIVLSTSLCLKKAKAKQIRDLCEDYTKRRESTQPLELPSAGSVFKRPEGYFAGKLISDADLKGVRMGGAAVSTKHAGFIVNVDEASAQDIVNLIRKIQNTVYKKFGVQLETEVKLIGEWED